jgi:hypothetical protein
MISMLPDLSPVGELKNIGPYMVKVFERIGIHTVQDLLDSSYRELKHKMISAGIKPHVLMFYSIEMGIQGRVWSDITPSEKLELKKLLED